jgi:hypothetical protein
MGSKVADVYRQVGVYTGRIVLPCYPDSTVGADDPTSTDRMSLMAVEAGSMAPSRVRETPERAFFAVTCPCFWRSVWISPKRVAPRAAWDMEAQIDRIVEVLE